MAKVIDGEASETDEEEEDHLEDDKTPKINEPKKIVHVDERIQQNWRHLATDTQTVVSKRNQPAVKMIQEQKEMAHRTFESVQSAATSLRAASLKLLQIEDGLADIREAAALWQKKFDKENIDIIKIS